jgi:hypothetical protein
LFRLEVDGSGVRRIELIPTVIRHRQVNRATEPESDAIAERVGRLSAELGTTIVHQGRRLWIETRAPIPLGNEAGARREDSR